MAQQLFCIEADDDQFQSVFPEELSEHSYPHASYLDAAKHLVSVRHSKLCNLKWGYQDPLEVARTLWQDLGAVAVRMSDDDQIDEDWLLFNAGTERAVIWHWFESEFDVSVAEDLAQVA